MGITTIQADPGLYETGGKCSPRQKCWRMRENKNNFIWEPMAALQDEMVLWIRKGILRLSLFGRILVPKLLRINSNKDRKCRVGLYDYDLPLLFIE